MRCLVVGEIALSVSLVTGAVLLLRSYENLRRLAQRLRMDPGGAEIAEKILEILQYDIELRHLVAEKGRLDPEMFDFLFGRPLAENVGQFGIRLERQGEKIIRLGIEKPSPTEQQRVRGKDE